MKINQLWSKVYQESKCGLSEDTMNAVLGILEDIETGKLIRKENYKLLTIEEVIDSAEKIYKKAISLDANLLDQLSAELDDLAMPFYQEIQKLEKEDNVIKYYKAMENRIRWIEHYRMLLIKIYAQEGENNG